MKALEPQQPVSGEKADMDNSTHEEFYKYYAEESQSPATLARFRRQRDAILAIPQLTNLPQVLDVADIGCGAGTLALLWAELGHRVVGVDINEPLVQIARKRAHEKQLDVGQELAPEVDLMKISLPYLLRFLANMPRPATR